MTKVAVVGIGSTGCRVSTPEYSWKELMYEAAAKAYDDAGVDPRREIDSFITCAEDYWEGFGIFDEFVPDQLGASLRPTCTVTGDGLLGVANGYMQIKTGLFDLVTVEAHSKASDILTYEDIVLHAFDPIWNKPLGGHPYYLAGLEMNRYLADSGTTELQCAAVVSKNRGNALYNDLAAFGVRATVEDVMNSPPMFLPLKQLDISGLADVCTVLVLASEEKAKELTDKPVWIDGIGWNSETFLLPAREWGKALYAELAAKMAYKMAGIRNPRKELDFAEVDDKFSYKELQHLDALDLGGPSGAGREIEDGVFEINGEFPVNPSGGSLGMGNVLDASGLHRAYEVVLQLRGEAGRHQLKDVESGLAMSWRGVPTTSGAVAVFRRG